MTTWKARLSEDGDRVLCGWTVNGRARCSGTIGWPVEWGGVLMVEFQPFYVQARPKEPGDEALLLKIASPAGKRFERGQRPVPGRRRQRTNDGRLMLSNHRFDMPALAPCPQNRLHGMSLVTHTTMTPDLPKV